MFHSRRAEGARSKARRQGILAAAGKCFGARGFHAASMQQIAAEAGLSVGQIYRYFLNKEAIIAAIIEEDLIAAIAEINQFGDSSDPMATMIGHISEIVEKLADREHAALRLEIFAEAARNSKVAELVQAADVTKRQTVRQAFARTLLKDRDPLVVSGKIEMVALLFEGLILRLVQNPCLDRAELTASIGSTMLSILGRDQTTAEVADQRVGTGCSPR